MRSRHIGTFDYQFILTKVQTWGQQQSQKIESSLAALEAEKEEIQRLLDWISSADEALCLRDQDALAETTEQNQELIEQHTVQPPYLFLYHFYPAYIHLY